MNFGYFNSPIGTIKIEADDEYITAVYFIDKNSTLNTDVEEVNDSIIICKKQLQEYFNGIRKCFDIKLKFLKATEFQKKGMERTTKNPVWSNCFL